MNEIPAVPCVSTQAGPTTSTASRNGLAPLRTMTPLLDAVLALPLAPEHKHDNVVSGLDDALRAEGADPTPAMEKAKLLEHTAMKRAVPTGGLPTEFDSSNIYLSCLRTSPLGLAAPCMAGWHYGEGLLAGCRGAHRERRPRRVGTAAALLRASALRAGAPRAARHDQLVYRFSKPRPNGSFLALSSNY
jgi:hypothetical protein